MHSATFTANHFGAKEVNSAAAQLDTTQTTVTVLDTSVLVSDPDLVLTTSTHTVVPLTVVEELDDLKTRPGDVGRAARTAVRHLERLRVAAGGLIDSAVNTPGGGTIRIALNGVHISRIADQHLDVSKSDNKIIAVALGLANEGHNVRLLSADAALRVKAAVLGVDASEHEILPGASVPTSSIRSVEVSPQVIDALYENKTVPLADLGIGAGASTVDTDLFDNTDDVENTFITLTAGTQSAVGRCRGKNVHLTRSHTAWGMKPRSRGQMCALDLLMDPDVPIVSLQGRAGTGKTMLALAAGLEQVFEATSDRAGSYDRLMIVRPIVAVGQADIGFLPGDVEDKLGPWFEAIVDTVVALGKDVTHRAAKAMIDGWVAEGRLDLQSVTYLRGRSLQRTWIIADEVQNEAPSTIKTVLTRLGDGSKIAMIGDVSQIDSPFLSEHTNALAVASNALAGSPLYGHVTLDKGERSAVADLAASRL